MIDGVLMAGRALAESLMEDRCRLERPPVEPLGDLDEDTGEHVPAPPTVLWSGPCQVQRPGVDVATPQAGEARASVEAVVVKLPVAVTAADVGDVVVVVASRDPALVGREFVVESDPAKTFATARKLRCSEVTS
ncbi:DUF6093 family protein [Pseudokineococcus lusitanus]|uniref:Uncharacterized protein n=1 Tax=Pseudokineococcus lusitanus TaxID=763993 RepID=A0A3N1HTU8_9ACTN|nr:DUF6093 family protein [Pseudokineococcus lusitanus]ROP45945.1 hypothetical protein EDC03_0561 [Pseudokineococcus lusitanus]